ncbi:cutinase family protein [Actinomadura rudentiformis]|uniref:Cutinase family protein n=1 Tax=Actinomadura rudentiformis TaxID=359158 RepID=A0A6H9Z1B2_9ACTN|nr:cutinase family protein [Actinomadura rudentiformis]KAB2350335.1 cutinase family protein [Actinomadura rudentiformis]
MRSVTHRSGRRILTGAAAMALAAGGVATVTAVPAAAAECKAVSVISARGTWEPQEGSWLQKPMGDLILQKFPGQAKYTELTYPAQPSFNTSAPVGVGNLISTLNSETQACPNQKYILLGYSQGAGVVGDALAATSARIWGADKGTVSSAASSRIAAIVMFGDIRFRAGEPYNVGTFEPGKQSGNPPPRPLGALSTYSSRIQNYCVRDDFVCQGSTGNFIAHLAYFTNGMPTQGVNFAVAKVQGG